MTDRRLMIEEMPEWQDLQEHYEEIKLVHMRQLFGDDAGRSEKMHIEAAGLLLDYSKNRATEDTIAKLVALAEARGLQSERDRMFAGEKINGTEHRAVLHTALRNRSGSPIKVEGGEWPYKRAERDGYARGIADALRWVQKNSKPSPDGAQNTED